MLEGCNKVSLESFLLQTEQPQLSQPFLTGEVVQPSKHCCSPPLDLLQQVPVSRPGCRTRGRVLSEQTSRITFLVLMVMQPRVGLSFWAASAYC